MAAPEAAGPAGLSTSAIARLLTSDMREELLAIIRGIFEGNPFAERLGISKEPVRDLLRTGQLGSVKPGRHRLIGSRGRSAITRAGPGRGLLRPFGYHAAAQ